MSYNYCNCSKDPSKVKLVEYGRSPYRMVLASREGICLDCGYYTIASPKQVNPSSGQLYHQIMGYVTDTEKAKYKHNWYMDNKGS